MRKYALLSIVVLFLVGLVNLCEAVEADFYVAANGSDKNPGTIDKPFATLPQARKAVRKMIGDGLKKDITVLIRGGTYQLTEPVVFGQKDSGTEENSITYANYPGEKPVISGGKKIASWKKDSNGRWKAKAGIYNFRQMYVNGKRAQRARGATQSRPSHYLYGFHVREKQVAGGDLKDVKQWGDLKSRNGTLVNGDPIEEAQLKAGDVLQIGPVKFIVQVDGTPKNFDEYLSEKQESAEHILETESVAAEPVATPSEPPAEEDLDQILEGLPEADLSKSQTELAGDLLEDFDFDEDFDL